LSYAPRGARAIVSAALLALGVAHSSAAARLSARSSRAGAELAGVATAAADAARHEARLAVIAFAAGALALCSACLRFAL